MQSASKTRYIAVLLAALGGCALDPYGAGEGEGGAGEGIPEGVVAEPIVGGVAATEYPEAAIVNMPVSATSMYLCSATLIAPRVILTAGHCVDGFTRFDVYVGATMRTATAAAAFDWNEHGATTVNPLHHDIGLVFLDAPVALTTYPTLASAAVPNGTRAMDVGRIHNGSPTSTAWEATTSVSEGTPGGFPYDYVATSVIEHGDSGGPVFLYGTHTLIAVNSGSGGGTEVLARVDLLRTWIDAQVAAHGGYATSGAADAGADARTDAAGDARMDAGVATDVRPDAAVADVRPDVAADVRPDVVTTDVRPDVAADVRPDVVAADVRPDVAADVRPDVAVADARPDAVADAGATCATAAGADALATANALDGCVRGALTTSVYNAYFMFTAAAGVTYSLQLTPGGDARYMLGVVAQSGTTRLCMPLITGQLATSVTVTGTPRALCIQVSSSAHSPQGYTLTRR